MIRSPSRTLRLLAAAAFVLVVAACGGQPPADTQTLSVTVVGNGTVTSVPAGINTTGAATFDFVAGSEVTLTAVAASGWRFDTWSGACSGGSSTCVVDLDSDANVTATFIEDATGEDTYELSVTVVGNGTVTSVPAGIDTTGTASFDFVAGTDVTLTAVAATGWRFDAWSGDCSGTSATCVVNRDSEASVTASFTELADAYDLTVTVAGGGQGSVTSDVGGIDVSVGESDTVEFADNTVVTLTATPEAGSVFAGWSGACTGTATCAVTVDADKSVTATFAAEVAPVTTSFNILAGSDDAEEYLDAVNDENPLFPAGSVDISSSDLDMAFDTANVVGTTTDRGRVAVGLRYANVAIPQGSTITSATITFTRRGSSGSSVTFAIDGQANDDANTFVYGGAAAPVNNDITGRARTTATVAWTASPLTTTTIATSDVSAIVQEIVGRGGWASGNALAFIITSANSTAMNHFTASSFEHGSPPVLTLTYTPPPVP